MPSKREQVLEAAYQLIKTALDTDYLIQPRNTVVPESIDAQGQTLFFFDDAELTEPTPMLGAYRIYDQKVDLTFLTRGENASQVLDDAETHILAALGSDPTLGDLISSAELSPPTLDDAYNEGHGTAVFAKFELVLSYGMTV